MTFRTLSVIAPALTSVVVNEKLFRAVQQFGTQHIPNDALTRTFAVPIDQFRHVRDHLDEFKQYADCEKMIGRLVVLGIVSRFDGYLTNVLTILFKMHPGLLDSSERTLTYREILTLGGLKEAQETLIHREVESIMRQSHVDQFAYLERKFSVELRSGLCAWPQFVEICERRNLLTHANGRVNTQYRKMCLESGVTPDKVAQFGLLLDADAEYVRTANSIFYEVAVKLGIVLWRKLNPDQTKIADSLLSRICYRLIRQERYRLAQRLLQFACAMPRPASERLKRMFIINLSNATKLAGNIDEARSLLDKHDWSASGQDFQISAAAIRDDVKEVARLMKRIGVGPHPDLVQADYHEWPVFKVVRDSPEFRAAYKDVFGVEFDDFESKLRLSEAVLPSNQSDGTAPRGDS